MHSPNEIFALSAAQGILHALFLVMISSLWGALILKFAIKKASGVKLTYPKAYIYNFIVALTVISTEFTFIYNITRQSVLTASDFIGPGNWFAILCSAVFAISVGTVVLGYLIKDDRDRRIGTNKSFAATLIYGVIFIPIGLIFRTVYFFLLEQQGKSLF